MKMKLLIATADSGYAEHLSNFLAEKYADTFELSVCSSEERLGDLLKTNRFEAALLEPDFVVAVNAGSINLPLVLVDETGILQEDIGFKQIKKYQRITSIAGSILESYAEAGKGFGNFGAEKASITAVWSPSGGSGKTTVALAYAAHKVSIGVRTLYLNLENFSSTSAYFQENGKSISRAFDKLDSNAQLFFMGIRQQDAGTGILYFCGPENYEDMNILTADDIEAIVNACAAGIDELVIDLSSQCDEKTRKLFELADKVLLVCETSAAAQKKKSQFINQHNMFGKIQGKTVFVNNKGAKPKEEGICIQLPFVQSSDPVSVYKTLSGGNFNW